MSSALTRGEAVDILAFWAMDCSLGDLLQPNGEWAQPGEGGMVEWEQWDRWGQGKIEKSLIPNSSLWAREKFDPKSSRAHGSSATLSGIFWCWKHGQIFLAPVYQGKCLWEKPMATIADLTLKDAKGTTCKWKDLVTHSACQWAKGYLKGLSGCSKWEGAMSFVSLCSMGLFAKANVKFLSMRTVHVMLQCLGPMSQWDPCIIRAVFYCTIGAHRQRHRATCC